MRASTVITSVVALAIVSTHSVLEMAAASPPDEYVSGLLHQPLGDITTFTVDGRKLTACCIGSSGQDGVEIRLHSLNGGGAAVDLTELQTPSPLHREIHIRPKGWDGTIKGSVRLIGNPDGSITEVQDFSTVGVTSLEWRAFDPNGVLIDYGVVAGPVITYGLGGDVFCSAKLDCFARSQSGARVENKNVACDFATLMTISDLTPDPITGVYEFVVTPVTCGGCPDPWSDVESVLITGSGITELVVSESQLRTFGLASWGLGQAHLDEECIGVPPPCASNQVGLVASNIGTSGVDGVAIDLGPGSNGGSVSKEKCRSCSNGHVTLMKLYDDEAQEVGRVAETSGTGIPSGSLAPDFSAIGSVEFDVAYIGTDGSALAVERCSNGTPLEVPEPHVHCAGDVTYDWKVEEGEKVVLEARLCEPSGPITLPSGAGVSGVAALRIRPVEPTGVHHTVRRLEFVSSNATDIVIHHASASTPVYVSGLPHELLGDVSTYTIDGRKLSACCLGSSGQDGVEVRFDSLYGGGASLDVTSLLGATGLAREIRVRPKGWDGTIKGTMRLASDPGGVVTEEYDFTTSGVTEMQWRLRDAFGNVLASGTEPGGVLSWGLDVPDTGVACNKYYSFGSTSSAARSAEQGFFDRVVDVTGLTPMPVSGVQRIEVVPICAGCPNSPLEDLRSLEVTGDGIPDLAVTEAHLLTFGVESWGVGQAHVREECDDSLVPCDASDRVLVADNLGSSGEDGVSIDLGPGSNGGSVSKEKCRKCGNGHVTLMKLYDDEEQEVGRVSETSGTGIPNGSLAPDFSAIGSLEFDVAYFNTDGAALAVERCSNGTPLEVPEPHVHCAGKVSYDWKVEEGEKVVLEARLCEPSGPITLPSGAGVSGVAALRIAPVDPTVAHRSVRRMEFTSADATDIVIHHASADTPVYVSGLPHHLLGEVSSYTTGGRKIKGCCLGSSGQDGIDVRLGSVHGGGTSVDISSLLGATGLDREIRIQTKRWGSRSGHMLILSDGDGLITEVYDFTTSGVTAMEWRLLNVHGGVLAEGVEPGGVLSWGLEVPDTGVACNKYYSFGSTSSAARSANQGFFDRVVSVTGLTPGPVDGVSRIEVVPVPCAGCPNGPLDELHSLVVTGDGLDDLTLSDAHLATFGVESWGVGQAHIREACSSLTYVGPCDASESVLVVENLGGLGQDGVTLDFGPDSTGGTAAKSKRCKGCPPGHVIIMKAFDDEGDETFRLTQSENPLVGQVDLTFDATSQGASHMEVSFIDTNGSVLAVAPQGPIASVSYFECSEVEQPETLTVTSSSCRFTASCTVTDYFVPGIGIISGVAAVEFAPVTASSQRPPRRLEITSNDPGGMVIESASSTPVAIGDIDRDGDIDLVDYSIFAECMAGAGVAFAPPGQCSSAHFRQCDLDKDVDVDLHDFGMLQVEFAGD